MRFVVTVTLVIVGLALVQWLVAVDQYIHLERRLEVEVLAILRLHLVWRAHCAAVVAEKKAG